jgi:hypothetical protein
LVASRLQGFDECLEVVNVGRMTDVENVGHLLSLRYFNIRPT